MNMQRFVANFCEKVFKVGGRIAHEAPSAFMPIIVRQAHLHTQPGKQKPVVLFISASQLEAIDSEFLKDYPNVVEIRIIEQSLKLPGDLLQQHLIASVDCLVAIGGRCNDTRVRQEISLSFERGLPTFIIGGTGGETDKYCLTEISSEEEKHFFARLNNRLNDEQNRQLLNCDDVYHDTAFLFPHIRDNVETFLSIEHHTLPLGYDYYQPLFFNSIRDLQPETRVGFVAWLRNENWNFKALETVLAGACSGIIECVGKALVSVSVFLDCNRQREKLFDFIRVVKTVESDQLNWNYELIKIADSYKLADWVVEGLCLAGDLIILDKGENKNTILVWYFYGLFMEDHYDWKVVSRFCNDGVLQMEINNMGFTALQKEVENIKGDFYRRNGLSDTERQGIKIQVMREKEAITITNKIYYQLLRECIIPQMTDPKSVDVKLIRGIKKYSESLGAVSKIMSIICSKHSSNEIINELELPQISKEQMRCYQETHNV